MKNCIKLHEVLRLRRKWNIKLKKNIHLKYYNNIFKIINKNKIKKKIKKYLACNYTMWLHVIHSRPKNWRM